MKGTSLGFTLIEVLVVVLIIGILTSIALPQYRKAVVKTKALSLLPLIRTIDSAEQVYYATYMRYTEKLTDLDITLPAGGSVNSTGTVIEYNEFVCLTYENNSVYCNSKDPLAPSIEKYFGVDYFICWPGNNPFKQKLCQSLPNSKDMNYNNAFTFGNGN